MQDSSELTLQATGLPTLCGRLPASQHGPQPTQHKTCRPGNCCGMVNDQLKARVTLQEVIIQNFRAKKGTAMAAAPEPPLEELLWTVAMARIILGPAANIQVPRARHDTIPAHSVPRCQPVALPQCYI